MNCIKPDNSLHIVCEIELIPDFNKLQHNPNIERPRIDADKLTKDFLNKIHTMLETGVGSDVIIECGGQEFQAHKFILMAHSDVFRAMFSHDTKEVQTGLIKMIDTNPTAVNQILTFMYSGNLPELTDDDQAVSLLELADKYNLESLKCILQERLISRLNISNVCTMLVIAYMHHAEMLTAACIPLIKNDVKVLINTPEWLQMKVTHEKLAIEILEKVATLDGNPPQAKRLRLLEYFYRT